MPYTKIVTVNCSLDLGSTSAVGGTGIVIPPVQPPIVIDAADFFNVSLWSGDSSSRPINTGLDVDGGIVWVKSRTSTDLSVFTTEADKRLSTETSSWRLDVVDMVTAISPSGFTVGPDSAVNSTGNDYVSWSFKKAPNFLDVVDYVGTGTITTVPHGLGSVPGMVIAKDIQNSGGWVVQHISEGGTVGHLFDSSAYTVTDTFWNDTPASDTIVTLGVDSSVNKGGRNHQLYVFGHDPSPSGIIQCSDYVGTGTTTDTIVSLGWKPQFLLVRQKTGGIWFIFDTVRGVITDGIDPHLNTTDPTVEINTIDWVDFTEDGFTIKTVTTSINADGVGYIFMAIREATT